MPARTLNHYRLWPVLLCVHANAQSYVWSHLSPATSPDQVNVARLAHDEARQRTVLFIGPSAQTWEWDGQTWDRILPTTNPPIRESHALAYDANHQRVVMFGGGYTSFLADTWTWDGMTWSQHTPPTHPQARNGHAMTFDVARQRIVLFGGTADGSLANGLNDTWEWDGTTWTQRVSAFTPPARLYHALAYCPLNQRVVLFGGISSTGAHLADTWEWDGTSWFPNFTTIYPSARNAHAMTFDERRQRVVLFGGQQGTQNFNDTWEWDGITWTPQAPAAQPTARYGHGLAFDATINRVVLFGGTDSQGGTDQTWINGNYPVIASASIYGIGCGSPSLTATPDASGRPVLGQSGTATITNAPTPFTAVAMGWSNQSFGPFALPITLTGIGMTGCDLWQSSELLGIPTTQVGSTTYQLTIPIPANSSLLGGNAYLQAYSVAPNANPASIIVSNGIAWVFGDV